VHPAVQRRLLECYEIARQLGGACLSPTSASPTGELRWRCAANHEWNARTAAIVEGRWCSTCERTEQIREQRLAQLRALAVHRGGVCLSGVYVRSSDPMRWRCRHGHEWEASAGRVLRSTWCPYCSGRRATLEGLQALAAKRGGECLSTEAGRKSDPHRWRCAHGHEWSAPPTKLREGSWCPTCSPRNRVTLAMLQELARSRGGVCLARRYTGVSQHVRWRCEAGHEWSAVVHAVKSKTWCPTCAGNSRGSLSRLREVARERGGRCLATVYVNAQTPVPWRCAEGHTWSAVPSAVVARTWCPTCSQRAKAPANRTHADLAELCRQQGGRVLLDLPSAAVVRGDSRPTFQCARGHTWTTRVQTVRDGHWCPECAGTVRGDLAKLQALAAERGGRCLATIYIDNRTPIPFECAKGHRWDARPFTIKQSWCPTCAGTRPLDLATLRADARARGGCCLADVLPGRNQPIEWACAKGHSWMASAKSVHGGSWCPKCRGHGTYTIERAKKVAAVHGGECLSSACSSATDALSWRCRKGHTWISRARNVLYTRSWCPRCGHQRAAESRREFDAGSSHVGRGDC